jgi:hypothetical protein
MDRKGLASAGFASAAWLTLCSDCLPGHAAIILKSLARQKKAGFAFKHTKYGFENLPSEWWHFTFVSLKDAPVVDVEIR